MPNSIKNETLAGFLCSFSCSLSQHPLQIAIAGELCFECMSPDHPWMKRVRQYIQYLPQSRTAGNLCNRELCKAVREYTTLQRQVKAACKPPRTNNLSHRERNRGPPATEHCNPVHECMEISPKLLPLLTCKSTLVFPFLTTRSASLPFCHSVDWDSMILHGHCHRQHCQTCVHYTSYLVAK